MADATRERRRRALWRLASLRFGMRRLPRCYGLLGEVPPAALAWERLAATENAGSGATPQGLAFVGDRLCLAESLADRVCIVHSYAPAAAGLRRAGGFMMPPEAVHTSGLAWDGSTLWAVDHVANRLYALGLESSLASGRAVVRAHWPTGLGGTSAVAWLVHRGRPCLALSDFMHSGRTYLRPIDGLAAGLPVVRDTAWSFRNGCFSQGLAWDGRHLLEANNNRGVDSIYRIDLDQALAAGDFHAAIVARYPAPGPGVEDLALGHGRLWTADERLGAIFAAPFA